MADDERVYKLTWIFEGQRFTATINEATANAISKMDGLGKADIQLTNVTSSNARKRVAAVKEEEAAKKAALSASAGSASAFTPATERVVTSLGGAATRQLAAAETRLSSFGRAIKQAQADVAAFEKELDRTRVGGVAENAEKAEKAFYNLTDAYRRLADVQDKAALSSGNANDNLSALDSAARNLRNQIDPLSVAQREYGQAVAVADTLLEKHKITQNEFSDAIRVAKFNFEGSAAAIRREAQATYDALIAASARYKASLAADRVVPGSSTAVTELTSAGVAATQLEGNIASGKPLDPRSKEEISALADELNRLAKENDEANESAQKLRDSLDPVGVVIRELEATLNSYDNLLDRHKLTLAEVRELENKAFSSANIKIGNVSGLTVALKEIDGSSRSSMARLAELRAKFDPVTTSAGAFAREIGVLNEAQRLGVNIAGGYEAALDKIYRKFGQLTEAELRLQEVESKSFTGTSGTANKARADAASPETIAAGREESDVQAANDAIEANNKLLGVKDELEKTARDSAEAFELEAVASEKAAAALKEMAEAGQAVRNSLNPITAAQRTYADETARLKTLLTSTDITLAEHDKAIRLASYELTTSTRSATREAETSYTSLTAAITRYNTAVSARPATPVPAVVTAATSTAATLKTNVATGERVDPLVTEATVKQREEITKLAVEQEKLTASSQRLKDELDPVGAIQRQLTADLAAYSDMEKQGAIDANELAAAEKRAKETANIRINDTTGVSANVAKAADDYDRLTKVANTYRQTLNPLIGLQAQYREKINTVNEAVSVNLLTQREANEILGDFVKKEQDVTAALDISTRKQMSNKQIISDFGTILRQGQKDHVAYASTATKAFGLSRIGMLEFQAAGVNTFQALAAGMNPLQVATMEGAQFIGAFVQSGLKIATLIGVVAPLAAIAVAIFAVSSRLLTVNTNLRDFKTNIDLFARSSGQTPESLQKIVDGLRRIGVSGDDAKSALMQMFKAIPQSLSLDLGERITKVALDISKTAMSTGGFTSDMQALVAALTGGVRGFEDYGIRIDALDLKTIKLMEEQVKLGNSAGAIRIGFEKIESFFSGKYSDSLGKGQLLIIGLKNAWDDLITAISKSDAFGVVIIKLTKFTEDITDLIKDTERLKKLVDTVGGVAAGTVVGGKVGGLPGAVVGGVVGGAVGTENITRTTSDLVTSLKDARVHGIGLGNTLSGVSKDLDQTTDATKELTKKLDDSKQSMLQYILSLGSASTATKKTTIVEDTGGPFKSTSVVGGSGAGFGTRSRREGDLDRSGIAPASATSATYDNPKLFIANKALITGSDEIKRLLDILNTAVNKLPEGYTAIVSSANRPNAVVGGDPTKPSLHRVETGGAAVDVKIVGPEGVIKGYMGADVTGAYKKFEDAIIAVQKEKYPADTDRMVLGTKFKDAGHVGIEGGRGLTTGNATAGADEATQKQNLIDKTKALQVEIDREEGARGRSLEAQKKSGADLVIEQARLEAYNTALTSQKSDTDAVAAGQRAAEFAAKTLGVEWDKSAVVAGTLATNTIKTAEGYQKSEVAGLRQAAMTQAVNEGLTSAVDVNRRYHQILLANATEAVLSSQKEITAFDLTITANERLAAATEIGTAAAHDADLQNQAIVRTHNAVALAEAAGDENTRKLAKTRQDATLEQIKYNDALLQTKSAREAINNIKNDQQSLTLQTNLTASNATPEAITAQLDKLKAIQKVQQEWAALAPEVKDDYLKSVDAVNALKVKLVEVEEQQRRVNDSVKAIADSISTQLVGAIDLAFDGDKPKAWGDRIKDVIKDVIKSVGENQFIKPLLGTVADTLGFSSAAKSLGTISGLSSSSSTGATTTTTTTASDGTKTTTTTGGTTTGTAGIGGSSITGAIGLGGSLSGASSAAKSGTVTSYLNNEIGPALGFAKPAAAATEDSDLVGTAATTGTSGSLFGSTTLTEGVGTTVGGAVTGLGTGAVVGSLTGGNVTNASIGGLVGGVAGAATGIPGGSIIGGAIGGAIGGLFGPKTKSNEAAGADINLVTGKLSREVGSKNESSNQDVSDITSSIKSFARTFATDTGVKTDLSLAVQSGLRDGIKIGYSGGGLGGLGEKTFKTSADAIDQIELDIAHNLTGLSGTMKTVLDQVTDAGDIADAVTFAKTYDDLKKAADDAFSSIEDDKDKIGPYAEAFNTLNDTFDELTISAEQFGLSLDPINDGLKEATKRLKDDFGKSLDAALDTATAKDYINTLQDVSDAYTSNIEDAAAIGLTDETTLGKTSKLEVAKARETLDTLTSKELQTVIDDLSDTAPELAALATSVKATLDAATDSDILKLTADNLATIYTDLKDTNPALADLAKSLTDTSTSADDAVKAIEDLAAGITSIADLSKSLKSGELSGLTGEAATTAAIDTYKSDLSKVTAAGSKVTGAQIDDLVKSGEAAIKASQTAYGNAPKTADLRKQIVKDLDKVNTQADTAATTLIKEGAKAGDVKTTTTTIPTTVATEQTKISSQIINNSVALDYLKTLTPATTTDDTLLQGFIKKISSKDSPATIADGLRALSPTDTSDITLFSSAADYVASLKGGTSTYVAPAATTVAAPVTTAAATVVAAPAAAATTTAPVTDADLKAKYPDYLPPDYTSYEKGVVAAYAGGTVPGPILVGEKGPEWMGISSTHGGKTDWRLVGKQGPEIINQKGGATILPFPVQPKDWMTGKGYSGGTSSMSNVVNMSSYSRGTPKALSVTNIHNYLGGTIADVENTPVGYKGGTTSNNTQISSYMGGTSSDSKIAMYSIGTGPIQLPGYHMGSVRVHSYAGGTNGYTQISNYAQGSGGKTDDVINTPSSYMGDVASYAGGSFVSDANNTVAAYMGGVGGAVGMPVYMGGTPDTASTGAGPMMAYAGGIPAPAYAMGIPAYAMGTTDISVPAYAEGMPEVTIPAIDTSGTGTGTRKDSDPTGNLTAELRALHDDLVAIKKQIQGGDSQAMNDAKTGHSKLSSIDSKLGSGLATPIRRAVG